eukprot:c20304_g1_i1 orf=429-2231(+)
MYTIQHPTLPQHRRQQSLSAYSNEKDEDLVLFHDMQTRERAAAHESAAQPLCRGTLAAIIPPKRTEEDIFTSSEWDKHDYDWLMTPPSTCFIPNVKHEPVGNGSSSSGSAIARSSTKATSKIGSSRSAEPSVPIMCTSFDSQQQADPSVAITTSTGSISRKSLSSSSSTTTRASTPARSTTPVSRPIVRPSTPSKSAASSASTRSSTPMGRAATPSNRPASSTRPSTPIKRPATPTRVNNPSNTSVKTSTVSKATSLPSKSASSSRPSSPATRVRQPAAHPAALPGTPQEPPANLRTSRVDRPHSNPRGSMALKANTTAAAKAPQLQPADAGGARNMHLSGSPLVTRGRVSSDSLNGDKSLVRNGKLHDGAMVSVSNGVGSKMVDRIMPPRKLVPLAQERTLVAVNSQGKKPVKSTLLRDVKSMSQVKESSGFGRNLSKKSLDMALRHMDIRGSTPSGFQSFMSNIPASSLYSVRSGSSRGTTGRGNSTSSIASSPMATSSNASSEHSMSTVIDPESSELSDETASEMGSRASPISQTDRSMAFSTEKKVNYWLGSPGYMDDTSTDIMQIFEQGLVSPESPLISQQDGIIDCDDFALEPI